MIQVPASPLSLLALLALAVGGLLAIAFAAREWRAVWRVLATPSTDVFSLSTGTTGPVSVTGRVTPLDDSLVGPFSGQECLAIEYEVEELRSQGKGSSWVDIDSGRGAVPFLLEDDTGSVLVDPSRVRFALDDSELIRVDGGAEPPERVQRFIERNADVDSEERTLDLKVVELNVGNDRRYAERRLDPGDAITVFGDATPRSGTNGRPGQVNAALTADGHPLVISDTTPVWTALRVFWPVLFAGGLGVAYLYRKLRSEE